MNEEKIMSDYAIKIASDKLHKVESKRNDDLRRENMELRAMVKALLNAHTVDIEIDHGEAWFYEQP